MGLSALEAFRQSNLWDPQWNLPLSPQNNNPWFYMACAVKIINDRGEQVDGAFNMALTSYRAACRNPDGTMNRWPGATTNQISQDELLGMSYLIYQEAQSISGYLWDHWGRYNNTGIAQTYPLEYNMYRFPWFIQYVRSRAGVKLGWASQLCWFYLLLWDMLITWRGTNDASGRLLIWVMNAEMQKYWFCRQIIKLWSWKMKWIGVTLQAMLALEPAQNPVLAEYATGRL